MKPAPFTYHRPDSLDAVLLLLTRYGEDAKLLAGGQSLVPMMNMRLARPDHIIDVGRLDDLATIAEEGEVLKVGALTRHAAVAGSDLVRRTCPILAEAAATVGHYAIRAQGTLGGSLALADPAAQFPLVALTLDAGIEVASTAGGRRIIAGRSFFRTVMTTALEADEMILAARFPRQLAGEGQAFALFSHRVGDFAVASAAATVQLNREYVSRIRLGIGGLSDAPIAAASVEEAFQGRPADAAFVTEAARAACNEVRPALDPRVPTEWRIELAEAIARRAIARAIQRARANDGTA